jgi:predicted nucleic acid-binding protein
VSQFVVDASVVLTWCFPDENSAYAREVAERFKRGDSAMAPAFWPSEVLNALLVGERRNRITAKLVQNFLVELGGLPVVLVSLSAANVFSRIPELCRTHSLTAYDAAYLHLAIANSLPLASLDGDLIRACERTGVGLL